MKNVLKVPVYIFVFFLIAVLALIYVYMFTTIPEREVNSWIDYRVLKRSGYNVSLARLNRDIWNHLILEGINIVPEEGTAGPGFRIDRAEFQYSIVGLSKGQYIFDLIEIDSVYINLPRGSGGGGGKKESSPVSLILPFDISAENIRINAITLRLGNDEVISLDSLFLTASAGTQGVNIKWDNLTGRWPARNIELQKLTGSVTSMADGFRLESVHLITANSDLFINGTVGQSILNGLDLSIGCGPIDLDEIRDITGVKIKGKLDATLSVKGSLDDFGGDAIVNGSFMDRPFENLGFSYRFNDKVLSFESIDGRVFHAGFRGSGKIDFNEHPEQYAFDGSVRHLDLREIAPDLATDFSGKVKLSGQSFSESGLNMRVTCQLDSVRIENYFFDQASGTVAFDLEKIDFLSDFRARYKHTYLDAMGRLEYSGDINLSGKARFEDLTDFTDQVFLKKLGGRGEAAFSLSGPTEDFAVAATFDSDSCWTYGLEPGIIHIDADLKSFIEHRVGIVDGYWREGELYSVPTDSGFFTTSVSGEMAFLDSVRIFGLDGGIQFNGMYDGTQVPPAFTADTLYGEIFGNEFFSAEPISVRIYERETDIESLKLKYKSGTLEMSGIVTDELDLGLDFRMKDFQIQSIMKQIYPEKEVSGLWSGTALLRGKFENPDIELDFHTDSLTIGGILLGRLESKAEYFDGYMRVDSTVLSSDFGEYSFTGQLPMDLSFGEVSERFPDEPIYLRLETSGRRLLLAEIFIDAVERYDTDFDLNLILTGTYSKPTVSGSGKLLKGILKAQYLVNRIQNLNAYVRMDNELIYIDSVFASVQEPGKQDFASRLSGFLSKPPVPTIKGNGTIRLLGLNDFLYDLTITGRNVYFMADAYDVTGWAGFNLKVEGETPPTIKGNVSLQQLEIKDDFDKFVAPDYDAAVAAVEDSTMWDLDMNITAPNNIWIKNRDVDAEFKANILVQRHVGIIGALGTLEAVRGSYNVLGDKGYRFQSGTITYPDLATVDPNIDFTVVKQLQVRQPESGAMEPLTMELHITGTLLVPKIDVPGFTKEEALKLLVSSSWAGRTISGERSSADYLSGISALATQMGLDPSTAQGVFDELTISDFEASKGAKIDLAKYVSPNLYVRYSRRLRDPESSIGVEYYLNNNFSFRATQGMKGSQNEGFSIDINLNYEY